MKRKHSKSFYFILICWILFILFFVFRILISIGVISGISKPTALEYVMNVIWIIYGIVYLWRGDKPRKPEDDPWN